MQAAAAVTRKGGRGSSSSKLGAGRLGLEESCGSPFLSCPQMWVQRECIPPLGEGPLELMKPPRPRVKGNRPQGLETVSLGGKGNLLSSLSPPRTSTPTHRRPWEASSYQPSLSLPAPLLNIWCHPKSVLVPVPTPRRLRTKDPGLHRAQEMEALWSVPASEAGPLDGSASGKGLTMA